MSPIAAAGAWRLAPGYGTSLVVAAALVLGVIAWREATGPRFVPLRAAVAQNLEKVIVETNAGHLDVGMHGSMFLLRCLNELGRDDLAFLDNDFSYEPYALMLRRNDSAFRLAVNRELARLYRTEEIYAIYERWLGVLGAPGPLLKSLYFLNGLPE